MVVDMSEDLEECKEQLAVWLKHCDVFANELLETTLTGVEREKIIVKLMESAILVGGWSQQIKIINATVDGFSEV